MEDSNSSSTSTSVLASSFDDHIRPLLDAIDRLRDLKVMQEGIELPTIVVVGDQSSGKSSVLESLAGISLPRGQGICTRVPLIMRLQHDPNVSEPELHLEYKKKKVRTSELKITEAINVATQEIAGCGKGISNTPLTLVVKKKGVPDLTMVDLPGITRVPVHGQPDDIYEQIATTIKEYIAPKESIILNVLSATADFPTCESIRMSQQVDTTGDRTLAVVTKVDRAPESLLEKVTVDAVNIGLGYVCVRNRVGDESYEEARAEEAKLFRDHPLLSRIDKSIVGIPVLARWLMKIQATSIAKCLPDIVKKINEKLSCSAVDLNAMPHNLITVADAMRTIMHMISVSKETLRKVLIRGEYNDDNDYKDDLEVHGKARLAEMLEDGKDVHLSEASPPVVTGTIVDQDASVEQLESRNKRRRKDKNFVASSEEGSSAREFGANRFVPIEGTCAIGGVCLTDVDRQAIDEKGFEWAKAKVDWSIVSISLITTYLLEMAAQGTIALAKVQSLQNLVDNLKVDNEKLQKEKADVLTSRDRICLKLGVEHKLRVTELEKLNKRIEDITAEKARSLKEKDEKIANLRAILASRRPEEEVIAVFKKSSECKEHVLEWSMGAFRMAVKKCQEVLVSRQEDPSILSSVLKGVSGATHSRASQ